MSISEVIAIFSIESGHQNVTADLLRLRPVTNRVEHVRNLSDTCLQFFVDVSRIENDNSLEAPGHQISRPNIALLKVGPDVYYPLDKSKSQVLLLENGIYLFPPSSHSSIPDHFLSIIFNRNLPRPILALFNKMLSDFSALVEESFGNDPTIDCILTYYQSPNPSTTFLTSPYTAEDIASKLVKASEFFAQGMGWFTEKASSFIHFGGHKLREMNSVNRPTQVDPKVINILKAARLASGVTSNIVEATATAVVQGASKIGEVIGPVVVNESSRIVSNVTGMDQPSSRNVVDNVLTVGSGGVQAIGVVCESLTDSVTSLGRAVAQETVGVVHKIFGSNAAEVTDDALTTAGNVAKCYRNTRVMRPKNLIKKTALHTISSRSKPFEAQNNSDDPIIEAPDDQEPRVER